MGIFTEFFAATPAELESMSLDWGPAPPPPRPVQQYTAGFLGFGRKPVGEPVTPEPYGPTLPCVQTSGILTTALGMLDQFVTGTLYDDLDAAGALDPTTSTDDANVIPLRRELRDGLAALPATRIGPLAREWGEDEELNWRGDFEDLEDLVRELVELARLAVSTGRELYLWVHL